MSDAIIRVENLGKKYRIQHQAGRPRYVALRDVIAQKLKAPFQFLRKSKMADGSSGQSPISHLPSPRASKTEDFWALKDVSFNVNQGDVVGIIGRNGAGKSTLLKILSRITDPTEGRVRIKGRVASLLEVGTGFHPELTGRENIFLNGAILGMHRAEIKRKFDEIVAFAEVEKFLDTPVKRYSSGMYVRLAFAVAAHLEPEILIVDEVLAVGDAEFQKKCLGKMESVAHGEGRTVLFVSHNMGMIKALCKAGIYLKQGKVVQQGPMEAVMENYLAQARSGGESLKSRKDREGSGTSRIVEVSLASSGGAMIDQILSGHACSICFGYEGTAPIRSPRLKFTIYNRAEQPLIHFDTAMVQNSIASLPLRGRIGCRFQKLPLSPGMFKINAVIMDGDESLDYVKDAFSFSVAPGNFFGTGRNVEGLQDICMVEHEWWVDPAL